MTRPALYPLRFEPIFKSMLWGGRRLSEFLNRPHPSDDPIGEAWVLSDVDGHPSRVADGPLAGTTLRELLAADPVRILGNTRLVNGRFPLLLKFIDARQELSVQVHPNDEQAARKHPAGNGKTEAWVVLEANPQTSRIYAGFRPGMTAADFRAALAAKTTPHTLHSFTPNPGDCVFLEAGTVHAIGADILLFEVQQTCDITYRLYDWDRVDAKTGKPRDLHIDDALACSDFARGPCHAVRPTAEDHPRAKRERLVGCEYFTLHRLTGDRRFTVGAPGMCRVVVVLAADGRAEIEWGGDGNGIATGDVLLIPAELGECSILPAGEVTLLECGLPG
ncbi:MAG TPA: type I phosphomannose isomerase catalytic subunit [Gemmataceae bacterium]|nr:type I phosphomannose isomerase catalytic subunit [Gemmataceae bacterium]